MVCYWTTTSRCLISLVVFLLPVFLPNHANAQNRIDPDKVVAYLQSTLSLPFSSIPTGRITIKARLSNPTSWSRTGDINGSQTQIEMGEGWYKQIQALEQLGVLIVRHDPELQRFKSGQSFDFKTFNDQNNGLVDRLSVTLADQYKSFLDQNGWTVTLPGCKTNSFKIVKTDYHKIAIEDYAAVFYTFHADCNPLYVAYIKAINSYEIASERKGIVLFKYDTFTSEWKNVLGAFDVANIDGTFRFNSVQNKLLQLSRGAPQ